MKSFRRGQKVFTPEGEGVIYDVDYNLGIVFVRIGKHDTRFDIDELSYINELWERTSEEHESLSSE